MERTRRRTYIPSVPVYFATRTDDCYYSTLFCILTLPTKLTFLASRTDSPCTVFWCVLAVLENWNNKHTNKLLGSDCSLLTLCV